MIALTNLNNQALILNCDLIKYIECDHDTVITLVSGEKLRVQEPPEEILERIVAYRCRQNQQPEIGEEAVGHG